MFRGSGASIAQFVLVDQGGIPLAELLNFAQQVVVLLEPLNVGQESVPDLAHHIHQGGKVL